MFMIWFVFLLVDTLQMEHFMQKNMKNIAGLLLGDLVCLIDNSVIK